MALLLLGLKPSSFLYGQNTDSLSCAKGDALFYKFNIRTQPDESIQALQEALPFFEKGSCWSKYVKAYGRIAAAYYYKQAYFEARANAYLASEAASRHFGEQSIEYASAIGNLSIFIEEIGNYKKSIELQLKSLDIEMAVRKEDHAVAIAMENLGYSYNLVGDFDLAKSYYEQALVRIKKVYDKPSIEEGRLLRQIAGCYWAKYQYEEALVYYNKSLPILDQLPSKKYYEQTRCYARRDLAEIHLELGQTEEAFTYIQKALDIQEKFGVREAYKSYLTLGNLYFETKDFEQALQFYQKAGEAAEQEFSIYDKHLSLATVQAHQAKVFARQKAYPAALEHYNKALQLITLEAGEYIHPQEALDLLDGKATLLHQRYLTEGNKSDLEEAFKNYQSITQVLQSIRRNYVSEDPKNSLSEQAVPIIERGITVAVELYQLTDEPQYVEAAFYFAESNKAMLLYETLREEAARGYAGIPDSLLEREEELQHELAFLKRNLLESKQKKVQEETATIEQWKQKVFELEKQTQDWIAQMEKQYPLYYNRKYQTEATSIEHLRQQFLPKESAIVEFMIGPNKAYIFFLTQQQLKIKELPTNKPLLASVDKFRALLTAPPSGDAFKSEFQTFAQHAHWLYEVILQDDLEQLSSNIKQLIIIPDDRLCLLPFELLLQQAPQSDRIDFAPQHLDYLFESYSISYHYSATFMAALATRQSAQSTSNTFLGFAPTFGNSSTAATRVCTEGNLYDLQCNREEVLAIQELMGGEVLLAEEARLNAFQHKAQQHQIVHLATHACVDEENAALSKIYLTDDNLTEFELNNLRLTAELTVLSACNTGSGKVLKGEGVMSLARSFMLAGSQSVLTSLWSVDDCATSDIMVHYYQGLKDGLNKDDALGQAKLKYLEKADRNSRHPSYWAAFVQFGDVEALTLPTKKSWYGLGLLVLLLVLWQGWRSRSKNG